MKKLIRTLSLAFAGCLAALALSSCSTTGDGTGGGYADPDPLSQQIRQQDALGAITRSAIP